MELTCFREPKNMTTEYKQDDSNICLTYSSQNAISGNGIFICVKYYYTTAILLLLKLGKYKEVHS